MALGTNLTTASELASLIGTARAPRIVDVRRREAFETSERIIAGACWRDHRTAGAWQAELPAGPLVVYCVHGHQVSQSAATLLRDEGRDARYLEGGIEAFVAAGGPTLAKDNLPEAAYAGTSRWLTAAPPTPGALACAWLIRRFIDPGSRIYFVEADWAEAAAAELEARPFALNGGASGGLLEQSGIADAALARLVRIVAGDQAETPGLLAVLEGLSSGPHDDPSAVEAALPVFDGLYAWCRRAAGCPPS